MTIHKEGYRIILVTMLLVAIEFYTVFSLTDDPAFRAIGYGIGLIFFLLVLQFFRFPNRKLDAGKNQVVSPCDGKVVVIEEVEEPEYFKDRRLQVSIFMSPLNVHANWSPIGGEVMYDKYHEGKFLVAWHPKSSTENERSTVVVKNDFGKEVLFRQVAGAVAKRIIYYPTKGDKLEHAENYGFIKFGSRVDLYLPLEADIHVKIGEKVKGIESIIATI